MSRVRLPLYGKILAWFALNLAVLALLFFFFLKAQFRLGLDWMLSGEPGDRIAALGDSLTYELSRLPETQWNSRLSELGEANQVTFGLFSGEGVQVFGERIEVPAEVRPKLMDRRPPQDRPARPMPRRPSDAPPKPSFMMRAGDPAGYWAGIHLDLVSRESGRPLSLLMKSGSITGGGLWLDLKPWLGLLAGALAVSALLWMPFVHGITGFIRSLNTAAGRIARGRFGERIANARNDELGELAVSVNAMAGQLGDYVREQKRITADVAHELCSPIARMQMALGVVEQRSTPEQASYLKKLDSELQHMAKLVEEVLAFSKAETLPEREMPAEFSLSELVHEVIAREAPETPVKLTLGDLKLCTLRSALDRALGNVIRNAVRYATNIEVRTSEATGRVTISVLDEGPGVPAEALPRLFDPFFRPEAARGRATGGSGLGLAITKRSIEACGGTVSAANRLPQGLLVEMHLPDAWLP